MKQTHLRGFGAPYLTGALPPADMPADVVALCRSDADAIAHSLRYAKARFGYLQRDVAKMLQISEGQLSNCKAGREEFARHHWQTFQRITGCALLSQVHGRAVAEGRGTSADRFDAIVEIMLRAA